MTFDILLGLNLDQPYDPAFELGLLDDNVTLGDMCDVGSSSRAFPKGQYLSISDNITVAPQEVDSSLGCQVSSWDPTNAILQWSNPTFFPGNSEAPYLAPAVYDHGLYPHASLGDGGSYAISSSALSNPSTGLPIDLNLGPVMPHLLEEAISTTYIETSRHLDATDAIHQAK
jgi:hypothetical protein